jgi:hypothetical protein
MSYSHSHIVYFLDLFYFYFILIRRYDLNDFEVYKKYIKII